MPFKYKTDSMNKKRLKSWRNTSDSQPFNKRPVQITRELFIVFSLFVCVVYRVCIGSERGSI